MSNKLDATDIGEMLYFAIEYDIAGFKNIKLSKEHAEEVLPLAYEYQREVQDDILAKELYKFQCYLDSPESTLIINTKCAAEVLSAAYDYMEEKDD